MNLCLASMRNALAALLVIFIITPVYAQDAQEDVFGLESEIEANEQPMPIQELKEEAPESTVAEPNLEPQPTTPGPSRITEEEPELTYAPDVVVEKTPYFKALEKNDCNCEGYNYLMPYKERRGTFGFTFALGYSQYTPTYYKPDFVVNETYETYYGTTESPLIEVTLGLKWNNFLGSLAVELGGGYYFNNSKNEDDNATLVLMPARLGATLALDTLFKEPYVVPYGTLGAYTTFYRENLATQSVSGNTPVGIYYAGGALIQLNSLDESAASSSYEETGLENTYVYVEMRAFLSSIDLPNVGTDPEVGAGLKLEY